MRLRPFLFIFLSFVFAAYIAHAESHLGAPLVAMSLRWTVRLLIESSSAAPQVASREQPVISNLQSLISSPSLPSRLHFSKLHRHPSIVPSCLCMWTLPPPESSLAAHDDTWSIASDQRLWETHPPGRFLPTPRPYRRLELRQSVDRCDSAHAWQTSG